MYVVVNQFDNNSHCYYVNPSVNKEFLYPGKKKVPVLRSQFFSVLRKNTITKCSHSFYLHPVHRVIQVKCYDIFFSKRLIATFTALFT